MKQYGDKIKEYGLVYNKVFRNDALYDTEYVFCAFKHNEKIYATDPYNQRILILDINSKKVSSIYRPNWFPRWIQLTSHGDIIYLDSENKTIGVIKNGRVIKEKNILMQEPLFIKLTNKDSLLVGGIGAVALLELDKDLTVIKQLDYQYLNLRSAEMIDNNRILVCDDQMHQTFVIDWSGNKYWEYGTLKSPGNKANHLFSPRYSLYNNGKYYIADGMNNRILCVNQNGEILFNYKTDEFGNTLWMPSCVQMDNETMIITDSYNKRIIRVNTNTWKSEQWGTAIVNEFILKGPRGIAISEDNASICVADTLNDRLVVLDSEFNILEKIELYNEKSGLFWPRAVCFANQMMYVADSRNKRIVILDVKSHQIINAIHEYKKNKQQYELLDTHDIRVYENEILLADALGNKVVSINYLGKCVWLYDNIKDPHSAIKNKDGIYIITDTGNNRIIMVNIEGKIVSCITEIGGKHLNAPRWIEEVGNLLLITDSGNNRIVLVDYNGNLKCSYGEQIESDAPQLRLPRCAKKWNDELLISDTKNNRVIKIPWQEFIKK